MIFKPRALSRQTLPDDVLTADKRACRKIGPCGVGKKALYLNSFYIDRRYYVPFDAVKRVYKRIAMSKGGYSGKGVFASIPYLVVEFDDGSEKQCNFKFEEKVDALLDLVGREHPEIPLHSKAAEKKLREKERRLIEKENRLKNASSREDIRQLDEAAAYLERESALGTELSAAAKAKRTFDHSNPAYRWVALFILLMAVVAVGYGVYSVVHHGQFAVYFLLFGLGAIFLFSSANVMPTLRSNRKAVEQRLADAQTALDAYVRAYPGEFPVPAHYAHAVVLRRMIDILAEDRAPNIPRALEQLKLDLKKMNSSVTVDQEEYEQIVAIKPLFLIRDYE